MAPHMHCHCCCILVVVVNVMQLSWRYNNNGATKENALQRQWRLVLLWHMPCTSSSPTQLPRLPRSTLSNNYSTETPLLFFFLPPYPPLLYKSPFPTLVNHAPLPILRQHYSSLQYNRLLRWLHQHGVAVFSRRLRWTCTSIVALQGVRGLLQALR